MKTDDMGNRRMKTGRIGFRGVSPLVLSAFVILCRTPAAQVRGSTQPPAYPVSAKELIRSGDYEGALRVLESDFAFDPSPALMFNIAMCKKALGRHVDAVRSFHQFFELEDAQGEKEDPTMSRLAASALEEELSFVSRLDIVDAPEGAAISIDGVSLGPRPLNEPIYLLPGNHTVTVAKETFSPMEIDVTAVGGSRSAVRAELKSAMSRVFVTCSVPNGVISIDETECGRCPCETDLLPGLHKVAISAPGKKTAVRDVIAETRHTTVLSVDLEPLPEASVPIKDAAPLEEPNRKWMKAAGIAMIGCGAVGLGLGGYFNYKQIKYADKANLAGNETDYRAYSATSDLGKAGLIVGYTLGGVLSAAGILLIGLSPKGEKAHGISLSQGGFELSF